MSDNAYIGALRISLSRYKAELSEIRAILALRALSNLEYRAAERTLQVSIEACIGVAKHWAKALASMHLTHLDKKIVEDTLGVVLKDWQDIRHTRDALSELLERTGVTSRIG